MRLLRMFQAPTSLATVYSALPASFVGASHSHWILSHPIFHCVNSPTGFQILPQEHSGRHVEQDTSTCSGSKGHFKLHLEYPIRGGRDNNNCVETPIFYAIYEKGVLKFQLTGAQFYMTSCMSAPAHSHQRICVARAKLVCHCLPSLVLETHDTTCCSGATCR